MDGEETQINWSSLKWKGRWGEGEEGAEEGDWEKGKADKVGEKQEWGAAAAREGGKSTRRRVIRASLCLLVTCFIWYWLVENSETSLYRWLHLCKNGLLCHSYIRMFSSPASLTPPEAIVILWQNWWWHIYYSSYGIFSSTLNNAEGSHIKK